MRWRYLLTLPLAGGVTVALALLMQAIIAIEFEPQPTDRHGASLKTYILEPQMIICGCNIGHSGVLPHRLRPPAQQNKCEYPIIENPHDDRVEYRVPKPEHLGENIKIDMPRASYMPSSCRTHITRIPPEFPAEFLTGSTSGLCKFSFVYDADGRASNIEILNCTHKVLAQATRKAVRRWRFTGGSCSGESPSNQRRFSAMRYDLLDEAGKKLPLPKASQ